MKYMKELNMYIVGGAVRDNIRNNILKVVPKVKIKDIDIAVESSSYDEMKDYIISLGFKIYTENPNFGTLKVRVTPSFHNIVCDWFIDFDKNMIPNVYDFAMCRSDGVYVDGRHPQSTTPTTIENDLARRDFTINAIAYKIDSSDIIDPYNGINDIKNRVIRCVGNPCDRFEEDGLRVLRAIRFMITLQFDMNGILSHLISDSGAEYLEKSNISNERIREEVYKIFKYNLYDAIIILADFRGVTNYISNSMVWLKATMEKK